MNATVCALHRILIVGLLLLSASSCPCEGSADFLCPDEGAPVAGVVLVLAPTAANGGDGEKTLHVEKCRFSDHALLVLDMSGCGSDAGGQPSAARCVITARGNEFTSGARLRVSGDCSIGAHQDAPGCKVSITDSVFHNSSLEIIGTFLSNVSLYIANNTFRSDNYTHKTNLSVVYPQNQQLAAHGGDVSFDADRSWMWGVLFQNVTGGGTGADHGEVHISNNTFAHAGSEDETLKSHLYAILFIGSTEPRSGNVSWDVSSMIIAGNDITLAGRNGNCGVCTARADIVLARRGAALVIANNSISTQRSAFSRGIDIAHDSSITLSSAAAIRVVNNTVRIIVLTNTAPPGIYIFNTLGISMAREGSLILVDPTTELLLADNVVDVLIRRGGSRVVGVVIAAASDVLLPLAEIPDEATAISRQRSLTISNGATLAVENNNITAYALHGPMAILIATALRIDNGAHMRLAGGTVNVTCTGDILSEDPSAIALRLVNLVVTNSSTLSLRGVRVLMESSVVRSEALLLQLAHRGRYAALAGLPDESYISNNSTVLVENCVLSTRTAHRGAEHSVMKVKLLSGRLSVGGDGGAGAATGARSGAIRISGTSFYLSAVMAASSPARMFGILFSRGGGGSSMPTVQLMGEHSTIVVGGGSTFDLEVGPGVVGTDHFAAVAIDGVQMIFHSNASMSFADTVVKMSSSAVSGAVVAFRESHLSVTQGALVELQSTFLINISMHNAIQQNCVLLHEMETNISSGGSFRVSTSQAAMWGGLQVALARINHGTLRIDDGGAFSIAAAGVEVGASGQLLHINHGAVFLHGLGSVLAVENTRLVGARYLHCVDFEDVASLRVTAGALLRVRGNTVANQGHQLGTTTTFVRVVIAIGHTALLSGVGTAFEVVGNSATAEGRLSGAFHCGIFRHNYEEAVEILDGATLVLADNHMAVSTHQFMFIMLSEAAPLLVAGPASVLRATNNTVVQLWQAGTTEVSLVPLSFANLQLRSHGQLIAQDNVMNATGVTAVPLSFLARHNSVWSSLEIEDSGAVIVLSDNVLVAASAPLTFWDESVAWTVGGAGVLQGFLRCNRVVSNGHGGVTFPDATFASFASYPGYPADGMVLSCGQCEVAADCGHRALAVSGDAPNNCTCVYPTPSLSTTSSPSRTASASLSLTRSRGTASASRTATHSHSLVLTQSLSPSVSHSTTLSARTGSPSVTASATSSAGTSTPSPSSSSTGTSSGTRSATYSPSLSSSSSFGTQTTSASASLSPSRSQTSSVSPPPTRTPSSSVSPTASATPTKTASATEIPTVTHSFTHTPTATGRTATSTPSAATPSPSESPLSTSSVSVSSSSTAVSATSTRTPVLRRAFEQWLPACRDEALVLQVHSTARIVPPEEEEQQRGGGFAPSSAALPFPLVRRAADPATQVAAREQWVVEIGARSLFLGSLSGPDVAPHGGPLLFREICVDVGIMSCHAWVPQSITDAATVDFSGAPQLRELLSPGGGGSSVPPTLLYVRAGGRSLGVCLSRPRGMLAVSYEPTADEEVLVVLHSSPRSGVTPLPRQRTASGSGPTASDVAIVFRVTAPHATAITEATTVVRSAGAGTVTVLSLLGGSPAAVGSAQRAQLLESVSRCPSARVEIDLGYNTHPLQFSIGEGHFGGVAGAIVGNAGLFVGVALVHLVAGGIWFCTGRAFDDGGGGGALLRRQGGGAAGGAGAARPRSFAQQALGPPPSRIAVVRAAATTGHVVPVGSRHAAADGDGANGDDDVEEEEETGQRSSRLQRVLAVVHLPGHLFGVALFLLQPTLTAAFTVLLHATTAGTRAVQASDGDGDGQRGERRLPLHVSVAAVALVAIAALSAIFVFKQMRIELMRASVRFIPIVRHACAATDGPPAARRRARRLMVLLSKFFGDGGNWVNVGVLGSRKPRFRTTTESNADQSCCPPAIPFFYERMGVLFKDYRPEAWWFGAVDFCSAVVAAVAAAQFPATRAGCDRVFVATVVLFAAVFAAAILIRPFHSPCLNVLLCLLTAMQLANAALLLIAHVHGDERTQLAASVAEVAAGLLAITLAGYSVVKLVVAKILKTRMLELLRGKWERDVCHAGIDAFSAHAPWRSVAAPTPRAAAAAVAPTARPRSKNSKWLSRAELEALECDVHEAREGGGGGLCGSAGRSRPPLSPPPPPAATETEGGGGAPLDLVAAEATLSNCYAERQRQREVALGAARMRERALRQRLVADAVVKRQQPTMSPLPNLPLSPPPPRGRSPH